MNLRQERDEARAEVERLREVLDSIALIDPSVPPVEANRPVRIARAALAVTEPKWRKVDVEY